MIGLEKLRKEQSAFYKMGYKMGFRDGLSSGNKMSDDEINKWLEQYEKENKGAANE